MATGSKTNRNNEQMGYAVASMRILLGLVFLWAFFDKLLGLGFSTPATRSWLSGASPTSGFLKATEGPFAETFHVMVGNSLVDWLFMLGLLGVGVGLVFGIAMRLSVTAGSVLLFLMWMASLPIKTNPIIDEHIIYIAALWVIGAELTRQKWSLASWWQKLPLVEGYYWFK